MTATRLLRSLATQLRRPVEWLALPRAAYLFPWPYEPREQEVLERELFNCRRIANDNAEAAAKAARAASEPVKPMWVRIR